MTQPETWPTVQPGDTFVLVVDRQMTEDEIDDAREVFTERFPDVEVVFATPPTEEPS